MKGRPEGEAQRRICPEVPLGVRHGVEQARRTNAAPTPTAYAPEWAEFVNELRKIDLPSGIAANWVSYVFAVSGHGQVQPVYKVPESPGEGGADFLRGLRLCLKQFSSGRQVCHKLMHRVRAMQCIRLCRREFPVHENVVLYIGMTPRTAPRFFCLVRGAAHEPVSEPSLPPERHVLSASQQ